MPVETTKKTARKRGLPGDLSHGPDRESAHPFEFGGNGAEGKTGFGQGSQVTQMLHNQDVSTQQDGLNRCKYQAGA